MPIWSGTPRAFHSRHGGRGPRAGIRQDEAARARDTLEWAELCAEHNREKAEAVARVQAAMSQASA